jgi:hypothetical protein
VLVRLDSLRTNLRCRLVTGASKDERNYIQRADFNAETRDVLESVLTMDSLAAKKHTEMALRIDAKPCHRQSELVDNTREHDAIHRAIKR